MNYFMTYSLFLAKYYKLVPGFLLFLTTATHPTAKTALPIVSHTFRIPYAVAPDLSALVVYLCQHDCTIRSNQNCV